MAVVIDEHDFYMSEINHRPRSEWVDYAKGIGITLVVYGHMARGVYHAGISIPRREYELIDSVIYTFHMPLFFFLSGLFFYNSFVRQGGRNLIASKIDSIIYPYVLWSIAQGLIEVGLAGSTNGTATYTDVFSLLWAPRAQFWFLYVLFFVFALTAVIFSHFQRKSALIVLLVFSVALYFLQNSAANLFALRFLEGNLIYFSIGILFSFCGGAERFGAGFIPFIFVALFGLSQYCFHAAEGLTYRDKGGSLLAVSLVGVMTVVSISIWLSKLNVNWIKSLGVSSMAIYLMHIIAGNGTRVLLAKVIGRDYFWVYLFVGCAFGLIVPVLVQQALTRFRVQYVFSAPISRLLLKWHV